MEASGQMRRTVAIAALILGLTVTAPVSATHQSEAVGGFDSGASRDIEEIVREYILNHPEIILESVQRLRTEQQQAKEQKRLDAAGSMQPVDGEDHRLGDPDASVVLVEFSDFECPFCKRFHVTVKRLMDEYGTDGEVAWVFRHFPIDSLHSKARKEAQATECANELGGNQAFWDYADRLFDVTPSNNRLDLATLPQIAQDIGLNRARFEACLEGDARGGKYAAHIEADFQDANASGGTGTPYSLVISPSGKTYPINGAQPYAAVKAIIELALKEE